MKRQQHLKEMSFSSQCRQQLLKPHSMSPGLNRKAPTLRGRSLTNPCYLKRCRSQEKLPHPYKATSATASVRVFSLRVAIKTSTQHDGGSLREPGIKALCLAKRARFNSGLVFWQTEQYSLVCRIKLSLSCFEGSSCPD